jgi:hypothetical protein
MLLSIPPFPPPPGHSLVERVDLVATNLALLLHYARQVERMEWETILDVDVSQTSTGDSIELILANGRQLRVVIRGHVRPTMVEVVTQQMMACRAALDSEQLRDRDNRLAEIRAHRPEHYRWVRWDQQRSQDLGAPAMVNPETWPKGTGWVDETFKSQVGIGMGPVHLSDDLMFYDPSGDHALMVIPLEDIEWVRVVEADESTVHAHPAIFTDDRREIVVGSAKSQSVSGFYSFVIHPTPPYTAERWASELRRWGDMEES